MGHKYDQNGVMPPPAPSTLIEQKKKAELKDKISKIEARKARTAKKWAHVYKLTKEECLASGREWSDYWDRPKISKKEIAADCEGRKYAAGKKKLTVFVDCSRYEYIKAMIEEIEATGDLSIL